MRVLRRRVDPLVIGFVVILVMLPSGTEATNRPGSSTNCRSTARYLPSGDQLGCPSKPLPRVTCRSPVPSALMVKTWLLPAYSLLKAFIDPSGDQSGSSTPKSVRAWASLPSDAAVYRIVGWPRTKTIRSSEVEPGLWDAMVLGLRVGAPPPEVHAATSIADVATIMDRLTISSAHPHSSRRPNRKPAQARRPQGVIDRGRTRKVLAGAAAVDKLGHVDAGTGVPQRPTRPPGATGVGTRARDAPSDRRRMNGWTPVPRGPP
jgi:hypothetical protein